MKKSFISLFLLTLILSHFSILNLLASGQLRRIWKYAAMVFLCMTVGLGEMWGAHQYILPVTSTTSYGGSSVERKIDNNTWVVYEANNYDNWVDFHLNVASANNYFFYVGVSSDREGNFRPFTNDTPRGVHGFSNSGWNNVRETDCGTNGVLQAGDNKISICNNGNNFNLYYIRLADAINTNLTVPSDLGIYFWEVDGGTKTVNNSDFSYSNNSDYMDYNGYSGKVAFKNSPTTATSRYNMVFPTTGKYQFIFPVYVKDNGTYSYPTVRVNSESTASGSITTVENNKLDSIILELDVSAGTYPIYIDFPATDKVFYRYVSVIEKPASCTAPNHVDVTATAEVGNYGWRYSIGETLKLTATPYSSAGTGSPITSGVTYQWKKKTGATTWKDLEDGVDGTDGGTFSGTTSANLVVSGLTASNAGTYKCVVSTGSGCDTESNEFWVRVFTFNGNYSGSSFVANPIVWTDEFNGTATVTLNANSVYEFKVYDNDSHTFGLYSPDIYKDENNFVIYRNDGNNVALHTGNVAGTYTFTVNVYYSNYGDNPYITLTSVRYPKKMVYMACGSTTWCDATPVFFAHSYSRVDTDVKMTKHTCEDVYYAEVPSYNANLIFTRQKAGSESIAWEGDNFYNKSQAITVGSNDLFTCTGWSNNEGTFSGSSYSPTTYTISFAGNGSDGGTNMTNVSSIACDGEVTLVANTWTKTGHSFSGWKTNVAVTADGSPVAANGIVPDEATISNITSDITLTAQWTPNSTVSTPTVSAGSDTYSGTPIDISLSATSSACSNPVVVFFVNDGTTTFEVTGAPYGSDGNGAVGTVNGSAPYTTVHKATFTATKAATYTVTAKLYEGLLLANFDNKDFSGGNWENSGGSSYDEDEDNPEKEADNGSSKVLKITKGTNWWDCSLYRYVSGISGYRYAHTRQYRTESGNTWLKLNDAKGNLEKNDGFTANTWQKIVYDNSGYDVNFFYPLLNTGNTIVYFDDIILSNESSMTVQATSSSASTTIAPPAYAIATSATNGSVSVVSSAAEGDEVTITATPSGGYEFSSWTITKTSDGSDITASVSLSGQTSSATFRMPAYGVTVTATFVAETCYGGETLECEDYIAYTKAGSGTTNKPSGSTDNYPSNLDKNGYTGYGTPSGGYYAEFKGSDRSEMWMPVTLPEGIFSFTVVGGHASTMYFNLYNASTGAKLQSYELLKDSWENNFITRTTSTYDLSEGDYVIGLYGDNGWSAFDKVTVNNTSTYTVTYNVSGAATGSTISAVDESSSAVSSGSSVSACTEVTFTASPASGYEVEHWQVNGVTYPAADGLTDFTLAINRNVTVTYTTVEASASSGYVVNYEVEGGNGTITSVKDGSGNDISKGEVVPSGTVLTFTASPSSGYAVLGWYTYLNSTETLQGNTQNSNTFNYEVTGDITIRVKFATPYTLTLNSSPAAASVTVSGGGSYVQGTVVSVSTSEESGDYTFVHWTDGESVVSTSTASNYVMPASNKTLTAVWRLSRISSLSWAGSEDLGSGMEIASSCFDGGCFDTDVTFTYTGSGTVTYYDNSDHSSSLGTLTSGTAINLNDNLRAHGIYIQCTSGTATLTGVSKTSVGHVYTIWSGSVVVSADYTGVNEDGDEVTLSAEDQDWWLQQVVLGPEHFQTAAVGDTLRVSYTDIENEYAKGAIQTATKYNAIPGNIYNESDGSTVSSNTGEFDLPSSGYYHIITAGSLDSLKNKGIVVKGKGHTITRVSLHASCSNLSLRTTAPDVATRSGVDIMASSIDFGVDGFDLGNWEHQVELDESCFTNVTVGSIINLYMSVAGDATLSFRCNVPSIIADDKQDGVGCPSYGDISFDRTIDDLYGHTPTVVGETKGYKVMYLKVDADMRRRLQETGMILCGKGTLIKVVEGVPETVEVIPGEERQVPTVVNNLIIHQGGEVTNTEDIEVLGKITYIRHAKGGALSNKLDQWYTFALPFTVSDVEVLDVVEEPDAWYDINAVYYSDDDMDQATNNPDGAGHYYLQYLKAENETAIGSAFAARWQYITPGHSLAIDPEDWDDGTRYGYPKKDSAYIILFDSNQPSGLSGYWESNPIIRFVGGPQTIDGVAKKWQVEADGEQYWMYANNTLHSFTLTDAYILNGDGTKFVLQESPTIRPFECYVQATASLKEKCAAISMRGFRIDNTTTGAESIQGSAIRAEKILRNGQLIIIRNGVEYDATGVVIR